MTPRKQFAARNVKRDHRPDREVRRDGKQRNAHDVDDHGRPVIA
jgi:hypothetical protein